MNQTRLTVSSCRITKELEQDLMIGIHCYNCGGFIGDPSRIWHRMPASMVHKTFGAVTTSVRCTCTLPVVYGPPARRPSPASQPGLN